MAKQKLTVKTDIGTFTRSTARSYEAIVVAKGEKAEALESERLGRIKEAKKEAAKYRRILASGQPEDVRDHPVSRAFDLEMHAKFLADGSYAKWIGQLDAEVAKLEALGQITQDAGDWFCHGWSGRLDLAVKEAGSSRLSRYRSVRIYEVASGALLRQIR